VKPVARAAATFGFGCLRVLGAVLPLPGLLVVARAGTRAMLGLIPSLRDALLDNAGHLLGPGATEKEKRTLAAEVLMSFARFAIEIVVLPKHWPPRGDIFERMRGKENYVRAASARKGILGVTLHMGNYEVGPMLLARARREREDAPPELDRGPIAIVFNTDATGIFERIRSRRRREHEVREIAIDRSPFFSIEILSVLRQRGLVLLAGDIGHEAHATGRTYPFLGGRARFQSLPARLAVASGAPLLPCFVVRDENGTDGLAPGGYRLEIAPPIFPGEGGEDALMSKLLLVFEEYLRRFPEQWLCIHRYWSDKGKDASEAARDGSLS